MAKKERTRGQNFGGGGSGASRAYATSRMRDPETMFRAEMAARQARNRDLPGLPAYLPAEIVGEDISPRPTPRPSRGMASSPLPTTRPANLASRMEEQRMRERTEMGNRQDSGMSRREMEQGFADGGMVRGCKPGQMSGKGFRGTY
jgi:hypothetical protein